MERVKTILFYFLSFTWGGIASVIGGIVMLSLIIKGYKPKRFHNRIYIEVGHNWGGLELGCFFITDTTPSLHTKQHEAGHTIQNIIFGVFFPILVWIPSAIRYQYRRLTPNKKHPDYDAIWFEGQATRLGKKYFKEETNNG